MCVMGARRRVHLQLLRTRGNQVHRPRARVDSRKRAGPGARRDGVRVRDRAARAPSGSHSLARGRRSKARPGCGLQTCTVVSSHGLWAAPGPAGSAQAEGPGIARWLVSLPSHPAPAGVTWTCERPQSEAVSLDQAQL